MNKKRNGTEHGNRATFFSGTRDITVLIGLTRSTEHEANCTYLHQKSVLVAGNALGIYKISEKLRKTLRNHRKSLLQAKRSLQIGSFQHHALDLLRLIIGERRQNPTCVGSLLAQWCLQSEQLQQEGGRLHEIVVTPSVVLSASHCGPRFERLSPRRPALDAFTERPVTWRNQLELLHELLFLAQRDQIQGYPCWRGVSVVLTPLCRHVGNGIVVCVCSNGRDPLWPPPWPVTRGRIPQELYKHVRRTKRDSD